MSNPKFRVAIAGGGIGGLTFAIALTKSMKDYDQHIQIDVYEAAQEFTEIGAGVGLFRRPLKIMREIGMIEELKTLAHIPDDDAEALSLTLRKSDQSQGFTFFNLHIPMGTVAFHRSEFQKALAKHLDTSVITSHFKKRLTSYTQPLSHNGDYPEPITLCFKDGTTATCDVLIGADGIHSATRGQMYLNMSEEIKVQDPARGEELLGVKDFVWSGSVAYRAVIPREKLEAVAPGHRVFTSGTLNYMGTDKHVIAFPISAGRLINVVAFYSEPDKEGTTFQGNIVEVRSEHEMLEQYNGWEPELLQILQCIEKPSRWAINNMKGLPSYSHGRIALLGDAAHAMTPHQGSGAGQAIDDAYILSSLLAHPLTTLQTLHTALEIYDTIRRPLGNDVLARSAKSGRYYEFRDPGFTDLAMKDPPMERLQELAEAIQENWSWVWIAEAETDRKRAMEMLEKRLIV